MLAQPFPPAGIRRQRGYPRAGGAQASRESHAPAGAPGCARADLLRHNRLEGTGLQMTRPADGPDAPGIPLIPGLRGFPEVSGVDRGRVGSIARKGALRWRT